MIELLLTLREFSMLYLHKTFISFNGLYNICLVQDIKFRGVN